MREIGPSLPVILTSGLILTYHRGWMYSYYTSKHKMYSYSEPWPLPYRELNVFGSWSESNSPPSLIYLHFIIIKEGRGGATPDRDSVSPRSQDEPIISYCHSADWRLCSLGSLLSDSTYTASRDSVMRSSSRLCLTSLLSEQGGILKDILLFQVSSYTAAVPLQWNVFMCSSITNTGWNGTFILIYLEYYNPMKIVTKLI